MKYIKASKILSSLMLALLCIILAVSAAMCVGRIEYKSYIAAFAAGAVLFAAFVLVKKKLGGREFLCDKLGRRSLIIILTALCFIINGAWIVIFQIEPSADFETYWLYAKALAAEQVAVNHYVALFPHIFGFSLFVSIFIKLFGAGRLLVPVINVILTCLSGIIIFDMCAREYGARGGAGAYLLWIFLPSKLIYNAMVLSEPLYTFLILLFIYIIYRLDESGMSGGAVIKFIICGLLSGLIHRWINCVRPIAAVLIIAFAIWYALLRGEKFFDKQGRINFALFAAAMLIAYIPTGYLWESYETQRMGEEPAGVTGYSIYVGFNPATNGSYSNDDMEELFTCYFGDELSATESHEVLLDRAKERITSGEISYVPFFAHKLGTFLGNDEGGAYYAKDALSGRAYSLLSIFSNIYYYFVILLSIYGIYITIKEKKFSAVQLCQLYAVGLTCAHMLVEVAGRYHYSIIPMLVISSAPAIKRKL